MKENLATIQLFGIPITSESEGSILKYILKKLENPKTKLKIFTPNPEIVMFAQSHPEFKKMLTEADVNLPDGVGLLFMAKLFGLGLKKRIAGVDFMDLLCQAISRENLVRVKDGKKPYSVGFFGGRGNVAKVTSECLREKYSGLQIMYASDTWDEAKISGNRIDLLFVAMGFPKQEMWIFENLKKNNIQAAMTVGGAFDFVAGKVPRAPKFLRTIGLEWLFRLLMQPWRIKRQLQLIPFVALIFIEFFQVRIFGKKS